MPSFGSVLRSVFSSFIFFTGAIASATLSAPTDLREFLVYTSDGIQAHTSDYQGRVASGGPIELLNFSVNWGLSAQKQNRSQYPWVLMSSTDVVFHRGAVSADQKRELDEAYSMGILAQRTNIRELRHTRVDRSPVLNSMVLNQQMFDWAQQLVGDIPRYETLTAVTKPEFVGKGGTGVNYFSIEGRDLNGTKLIRFQGNDRELFVVQVKGRENVSLVGTHFDLQGVRPGQILFFFAETPYLVINQSGSDAVTGWGIPANFFGPLTTLIFNRALITGSVWMKRIQSYSFEEAWRAPGIQSTDPAGQINFGCFPWARLGLTCNCY